MEKIKTSNLLVVEICRTAVAWTRVYKNQRARAAGRMLFETSHGSKTLSDRQLVRRTLKTMLEIGSIVSVIPKLKNRSAKGLGLQRDFVVLCIDDEDRARVVKMFA
jgi:hypothetical protein